MHRLCFFICIMTAWYQVHSGPEQEAKPAAGWDHTGELSYSYAYARSWVGNKMRTQGWRCTKSFSSGRNGTVEHSIWINGTRTVQMMIWRISSGRTGFAQKELNKGKFQKIL